MPLTASSGYLFGLVPGAAVVLTSATIAACISFFIGRTLLRDWARSKTEGQSSWILRIIIKLCGNLFTLYLISSYLVIISIGNKLWKTIDTAVGREGFKIILLLRLSPLLPFAISNYLYGITSVDFGYVIYVYVMYILRMSIYIYMYMLHMSIYTYMLHMYAYLDISDLISTLPLYIGHIF